jgi:hypothetical protein
MNNVFVKGSISRGGRESDVLSEVEAGAGGIGILDLPPGTSTCPSPDGYIPLPVIEFQAGLRVFFRTRTSIHSQARILRQAQHTAR